MLIETDITMRHLVIQSGHVQTNPTMPLNVALTWNDNTAGGKTAFLRWTGEKTCEGGRKQLQNKYGILELEPFTYKNMPFFDSSLILTLIFPTGKEAAR